ncbi:MAG: hypothetical protein ACRD12_13480 [Acidimicrobiales bacterium]
MSDSDEITSGQRVVLGRRDRMSMVGFKWSGKEPSSLDSPDDAQELGAKWEGDELVVYDYPGFLELLEYYEKGEYLSDND